MEIDLNNVNTLWRDAKLKELGQIDKYKTLKDNGQCIPNLPYKKIKVNVVYDIKPSLMRKARLIADRHLTQAAINSVYSSAVSQ